nr:hypothetical protein [Tanacetum cinerariifolium]
IQKYCITTIQAQLNNLGRQIKNVNEKEKHSKNHTTLNFEYQLPNEEDIEQLLWDFTKRDRNPSYQERRKTIEETLNKFMAESVKRHEENSTLIKEIRASTDAAIRNQEASIKEYGYDEKEVLKEFEKLKVSSNESALKLKRLLREKRRIEEEIKAKMNEHCSKIIEDDLPPKERDPGSITLPCTINNISFNKALANFEASRNIGFGACYFIDQ